MELMAFRWPCRTHAILPLRKSHAVRPIVDPPVNISWLSGVKAMLWVAPLGVSWFTKLFSFSEMLAPEKHRKAAK
jgi:hypothetical protein